MARSSNEIAAPRDAATTRQIEDANKLIETIAMYGRIGHDRPRDYRELCQDYLKKYLPNSLEVMK